MAGIRMVPSAATSATAEPEISAKNIEVPITTIARPPRMKPNSADANAISRREIDDAFMMAPAKMNSEILTPSRTVLRDGSPVALTPKEYDLLLALLRRDGACITRSELLTEVWGYSAEVMSRTVDTHVAELRRKLEHDPANPQHILTVRKTGYRLAR